MIGVGQCPESSPGFVSASKRPLWRVPSVGVRHGHVVGNPLLHCTDIIDVIDPPTERTLSIAAIRPEMYKSVNLARKLR